MPSKESILVVDDERSITDALELILGEQGYGIKTAQSVAEAKELIAARPFNLIFTDLRLPDASGIELLTHVKSDSPQSEVILMTAHGSLDVTVEAIKKGAYYYLEKPFTPEQVLVLATRALQFAAVREENRALRRTLAGESESFGIIGHSPQMHQIFETIRATAPSDASVLIEGESGTGKEMVARAIHRRSLRASKPFVAVNCGAIPPALFESEFFGHERGAFTDAREARTGRFEQAQGGTLFLDEVGELPLDTQVKLLRALQEKEITKVGGRASIKLDVRVIAATNVELQRSV
jgi:DNA-binding NtrC family response regulator